MTAVDNVIAVVMIVVSIVPIWIAQRVAGGDKVLR
jgi:hypothetical protein